MFPLGEGQFIPGYFLELWVKGFPAFSYVIDAIDEPDVLFSKEPDLSRRFQVPCA